MAAALDAIVTIDHQGKILEFNPAAEQTFGYAREDVLGREMAELLIPPSLRDLHRQSFARYLATRESSIIGTRLEMTALRSDGSEIPVELTITEISADGPPMFTGYVRDISEERDLKFQQIALLEREKEARAEAEAVEGTLAFLLQASTTLGSTLDYQSTLDALADMAVESVADICVIDVDVDGGIRRDAVAIRDEALRPAAEALRALRPDPNSDHPVARVMRTRQAEFGEITPEMRAAFAPTEELRRLQEQVAAVSYACAPLMARDRTLGTIMVVSRDPDRLFTQADVELLGDLAQRAALAIDNAKLHEETRRAVQLREESLALLDTLLATAPVGLAFVDRDLRYVRINDSMAAMNAATPEAHMGRTVREMLPDLADLVEPLHRRVLETGEPILDVELGGGGPGRPDVQGYWQASYYPVRAADGSIMGVGVVVIDISERKRTEDELRLARRDLTTQLQDVNRLLQLSGRLSASLELEPVLEEVLRAVIGLQGADFGVLRLYDPETDELEAVSAQGLSEEYLTTLRRVPAQAGAWGRVFAERRPIITEDVETDEVTQEDREAARLGGYRAVFTSPLITRRGDRIGTIATHFRKPRRPTERQARLIELYALEAADVIDNARLFRDAREAQERLEFLAEASRILSASLDYDRTLNQVARLIVPRLADWCSVEIKDEDGSIRQLAVAHVDPEKIKWAKELQATYPPDPNAPTGAPNVIRTGRSELYPEIPAEMLDAAIGDDQELRRIVDEMGFSSVMVVPLIARRRTLGALTFVTAESGRHYGSRDLAFAEDLARRAAQAVDNARLFTEQRHIARTLQLSLLPPQLPDIPGVEAAARYRAAGEGTEVGGDFYDVFATRPDEWGVVMGDVCGKGPEAAAVTGLARYTIRAAAMQDRTPSAVLTTLNEAIRRQREDLRFATVAYMALSKRNGAVDLQVSCGGHPLPLVLRAQGRVENVGRPGTLLGIFEDAELADERTVLERGDAVILYTDGISQEGGDSKALTEEELASLVASCRGMSADGIADRLLQAAVSGESGGARDDVAVLVVRVRP